MTDWTDRFLACIAGFLVFLGVLLVVTFGLAVAASTFGDPVPGKPACRALGPVEVCEE